MTGVEEIESINCFRRLFKCCCKRGDETDGDTRTEVKVELNFVCCGANNEKKKSKVKLERYKSRSFQSLFSFHRKRDHGNKRYGYEHRETEV